MTQEEGFYVVWQPESGAPTKRHRYEHLAVQEAERLAAMNPGRKFYVLAASHVSQHVRVTTTRLEFPMPF